MPTCISTSPAASALPVAEREDIEPASLVRPDGMGVEPARWRPGHVELLKLAATLPGVDRILVNPAIKRPALHRGHRRSRLAGLIRPWWGHASHMHIHFRCPADQPECPQPPPPPPGDSCDASLQWWFDQIKAPPSRSRRDRAQTPCPAGRPAAHHGRAGVSDGRRAAAVGERRRAAAVGLAGFTAFINLYTPQAILHAIATIYRATPPRSG